MKRRLSGREITLLVILLLLVLVSGYYLWFYAPASEERTNLEGEITYTRDLIEAEKIRVEHMRQMERELEELFAEDPGAVSMAAYDNSQNVMFELNTILSEAEEYTLNFSTVDAAREDGIVRRSISMNFESGSYEAARDILQKLHDSPYRCMMDDLSVNVEERAADGTFSLGSWWYGSGLTEGTSGTEGSEGTQSSTLVRVTAVIVFFEYV